MRATAFITSQFVGLTIYGVVADVAPHDIDTGSRLGTVVQSFGTLIDICTK
jgi:hypothetical protein